MTFLCPNCQNLLTVDDGAAGQQGFCDHCHKIMSIPVSPCENGVVFGDFVVLDKLSETAVTRTFRAHQLSLDRLVLLKVLSTELSESVVATQDFLAAARTAAKVSHPHLHQVHTVTAENGTHFLVAEHLEGQTLAAMLQAGKTLSAGQAAAILEQGAQALDTVWNALHMTHANICPETLFITDANMVKITDFGFAGLLRQFSRGDTPTAGAFCGEMYLAPEVRGGKRGDCASDQYSLAATVRHALTGCPPEDADAEAAPTPLNTADVQALPGPGVTAVPQWLTRVLERALATDPAARFASGAELARAISSADRAVNAAAALATVAAPDRVTADWTCAYCHKPNQIESHFCVHCGALALEECLFCKEQIPVNARYCPHCGGDVVQRKGVVSREKESLLQDLEHAIAADRIQEAATVITRLEQLPLPPFSERAKEIYCLRRADVRAQLEQQLATARQNWDMKAFHAAVNSLNTAFDADSYAEANEILKNAQSELRNRILQAGTAVKTHCLRRAFDLLTAPPQWKGGRLGSQREELERQAETSLQAREQALQRLRETLREDRTEAALEACAALLAFQLSPKIMSVQPAKQDTAFNQALIEAFQEAAEFVEAKTREAAARDSWDEALRLVRCALDQESEKVQALGKDLGRILTREANARFAAAASLERKKRWLKSRAAWSRVLAVPERVLPADKRQYAQAFAARRKRALYCQFTAVAKLGVGLLFMVWVGITAVGLAGLRHELDLAAAIRSSALVRLGPIVAQLLAFLVIFRQLRNLHLRLTRSS